MLLFSTTRYELPEHTGHDTGRRRTWREWLRHWTGFIRHGNWRELHNRTRFADCHPARSHWETVEANSATQGTTERSRRQREIDTVVHCIFEGRWPGDTGAGW